MITTPGTPDKPSFQLHAYLEHGHLVIHFKTNDDDSVMVTTYVVSMGKIETDRDRIRDEIDEIFTGAEFYEPGQVVISGTEDAAEIIESLLPHIRFNRPANCTQLRPVRVRGSMPCTTERSNFSVGLRRHTSR